MEDVVCTLVWGAESLLRKILVLRTF